MKRNDLTCLHRYLNDTNSLGNAVQLLVYRELVSKLELSEGGLYKGKGGKGGTCQQTRRPRVNVPLGSWSRYSKRFILEGIQRACASVEKGVRDVHEDQRTFHADPGRGCAICVRGSPQEVFVGVLRSNKGNSAGTHRHIITSLTKVSICMLC